MNDNYSIYLQSEAWENKRQQRLVLSGRRCEACGGTDTLQVHHLTYARIFQEDMEDLMALCKVHHEAVEEFCRKGAISKVGDPRYLRRETLRFVAVRKKSAPPPKPSPIYLPRPLETSKQIKRRIRPQLAEALETQNVDAFLSKVRSISMELPQKLRSGYISRAKRRWASKHGNQRVKPPASFSGAMIALRKGDIEAGRSKCGGWNAQQIRCLGEKYPLKKGWFRRIIGKTLPIEIYHQFLALKSE